jgi:hypothetical protein
MNKIILLNNSVSQLPKEDFQWHEISEEKITVILKKDNELIIGKSTPAPIGIMASSVTAMAIQSRAYPRPRKFVAPTKAGSEASCLPRKWAAKTGGETKPIIGGVTLVPCPAAVLQFTGEANKRHKRASKLFFLLKKPRW